MSAPWKGELSVCHDYEIHDASGHVLSVPSMRVVAKALVHRANAYPKLVEALEFCVEALEAIEEPGRGERDYSRMYEVVARTALPKARAALASTREEG